MNQNWGILLMNHPAAILFPTMVHGAIIANSAYVTISSQKICPYFEKDTESACQFSTNALPSHMIMSL